MFNRVLNAFLVFYEITTLRITFFGTFFVLKLQVRCLRYFKISATHDFSGTSTKLFRIADFLANNSGDYRFQTSDFTRNYYVLFS